MRKIEEKKNLTIDDWLIYIRFLFNIFVLGFISVILTGKLLTQLPVCKMEGLQGKQIIQFNIWIVNFRADQDEAVIGFASFLSIFIIVGLTIGEKLQSYFNNHFGTELVQLESIWLFSAFCGVAISFIIYIIHKLFRTREISYSKKYNDLINKLSKNN